jgi:hypothetical protein
MPDATDSNSDSYVDVTSAAIGLSIAPAYRPAVVEAFRQLAATADLLMSFPLPDAIDPATVFRP